MHPPQPIYPLFPYTTLFRSSVPESEARLPRFSFTWRAYQFVDDPESAAMIASCGNTCDSSCATRCGFIGSPRSEERRVGKECRSRWAHERERKKDSNELASG